MEGDDSRWKGGCTVSNQLVLLMIWRSSSERTPIILSASGSKFLFSPLGGPVHIREGAKRELATAMLPP